MSRTTVHSTSQPPVADKFLRYSEVTDRTSLSKATIWRLVRAKKFPRSYLLSPGRVAWLCSDIAAWVTDRSPRTEKEAK